MWTIEEGVYDNDPVTNAPQAVLRVWRMHPPPWQIVWISPAHERKIVEEVVRIHNEDVEKAGETPQLGLIPRRVVAQALRAQLLLQRPRSSLDRRFIENFIQWLEDEEKLVPAGIHDVIVRLEHAMRSLRRKREEIQTDEAWTADEKHDILRYYEGHLPWIRDSLRILRRRPR